MSLGADDLATLSKLLDEALDLAPRERAAWLGRLDERHAALRPTLRAMLSRHESGEVDAFLRTLPRFIDPARDAPLAGAAVGPYVLLREIGRGGMGEVWLAQRADGMIKRPVALKLPHRGWHDATLALRFERERDILAGLAHPNIARLYDAGVAADGQGFLALEYVEGVPLTEFCDQQRLAIPKRIELFLQVLQAVQYAHSRLVIHRDLKPSNILVTPDGRVSLLDFGIARLISERAQEDPQLTQLGMRALTPGYASPEQIAGLSLSTATDIYSLGVIFYELLTGARPYQPREDTPRALEQAVVGGAIVRPSRASGLDGAAANRASGGRRLAKLLAGDLDTIALKALSREPARRYASADAFAQDLTRYLQGDPVLARPDSTWYRLGKFIGRNRLAAGAGVAVLLALAVGLGVSLWQAGIAREQTRRAQTEARTAEAVQDFLEAIFKANSANQPDPLRAQKTTARELLDIGAQKIARGLDDAPAAKVRVLGTLANLYDELDLMPRELDLARARVDLARKQFGPRSAELAEALVDLATGASKAALNREADPALEQARVILDARGDTTSLTRAKYEVEISNRLYDKQASQAEGHVDTAIRLLRTHPPSLALVDALSEKAAIDNHIGRDTAAAAAALEAVGLARRPELEARSYLPFLYTEVAKARMAQEDPTDAEANLRLAVGESVARFGAANLQTLRAEDSLGTLLLATSRMREALTLLWPARDAAQRIAEGGETSSLPAYVMFRYARALLEYGRTEAGLAMLARIVELRQHLETRGDLKASLAERRAQGLLVLGDLAQAGALLDEAAAIRAKLGQEHSALFNPQAILRTELLLARGEFAAAAAALRGFTAEASPPGTVSRPSLDLQVERSKLALAAGRTEEALVIAREALTRIAGAPTRRFLALWEARSAVLAGRAQLAAHRPGQALPLLTRGVKLERQLFDPQSSVELADDQLALARCLLALGSRQEAAGLVSNSRGIFGTYRALAPRYANDLRALGRRD